MRIKFSYIVAFIILVVGASSLPLHSEELRVDQSIRWKTIPGAGGYTIEVEDSSGTAVVNRKVTTNQLGLNLPPGKYRFRITALNKFQKVGKVYEWQELIVKPVGAPVVKDSPAIYNPNEAGESFTAKGDYLHRGTSVELVAKNGKRFKAKVEVLPDGNSILVTPPPNLPEGDYKITYKNSRGKPFEDNLVINRDIATVYSAPTERSSIYKEKISSGELASQDPTKPIDSSVTGISNEGVDSKYNNTYSLFWRQALIPGWGHYYAGDTKTGNFYFIGSVALTSFAIYSSKVYNVRRSDYSNAARTGILLSAGGQSFSGLDLFSTIDTNSNYKAAQSAKITSSTAWGAVGGFYIISLIHILVTGANQTETANSFLLESFPEVWGNEIGTKYRAGFQMKF